MNAFKVTMKELPGVVTPQPQLRPRREHDPVNPAPFRVVVVDDEEVVVEIVSLMLRSRFHVEVLPFCSSLAAWEELERTSPDLLIVGGMMPDLLGEEIVRGLMVRSVTYPILVVSGYLNRESRARMVP